MMKKAASDQSNAFTEFVHTKYFHDLNGLRAISIMIVIYFHVTGAGANLAHSGVNLFFVISGFLITTLLMREYDVTGSINLRFFYARRLLRIFPVYYAVILLQVLLVFIVNIPEAIKDNFLDNLIYFFTFTQNWFVLKSTDHPVLFYHSWSLATEEQFYLLWPAVLLMLRTWRSRLFIMSGLLVFDYVMELYAHKEAIGYAGLDERILTSFAAPICLGCIFALMCNRKKSFLVTFRLLGKVYVPVLALLAFILSLKFEVKVLEHITLTFLVVSSCIQRETMLSKLLRLNFINYIGAISYGMYLMHMLAVNAVRKILLPNHDPHSFSVFCLSLLITILMASISYHCFEIKFLKYRLKLR